MRDSELLFPNKFGGYRAESHLDRAFDIITKEAGINKNITPRAMRRTFQDLARAAEVRDIVTRSVSGHSSEAMQRHYSTVSSKEQKEGLAKVVSLAKFREAAQLADLSGSASGSEAPNEEAASRA
jgi:integrase